MPPRKHLCCTYCDWNVISFHTEEELKKFNLVCPKCGCPILELRDKIKSA